MKRHSVLLSMTVVAFFASADPGRAACQEQSANGFIVLGNGLIEVEIFLADTNGDGLPETYQCPGETPLTLIQGSNLLSCPNESFDFEVWVGDTTNDSPVFAGNVPVAFFGGDGDDHLCLWSGRRQRAYGGLGNDYLFGGPDRDRLYGEAGADVLQGGAGRDLLFGGNGDYSLYGGVGADQLKGERGKDTLHGGHDKDKLGGGPGNDQLLDAGTQLKLD